MEQEQKHMEKTRKICKILERGTDFAQKKKAKENSKAKHKKVVDNHQRKTILKKRE